MMPVKPRLGRRNLIGLSQTAQVTSGRDEPAFVVTTAAVADDDGREHVDGAIEHVA